MEIQTIDTTPVILAEICSVKEELKKIHIQLQQLKETTKLNQQEASRINLLNAHNDKPAQEVPKVNLVNAQSDKPRQEIPEDKSGYLPPHLSIEKIFYAGNRR